MTCPTCGEQTKPGRPYCGSCGAELPVAPAPAPVPEPAAVEPLIVSAAAFEPEPLSAFAAPVPQSVPASVAEAPAPSGGNPFLIGDPSVVPVARLLPAVVPVAGTPPFLIAPPGAVPAPIVVEPEADLDATRAAVRRKGDASWRLVLADGQQQVINGQVLIGREVSADARWPAARLISVVDSTKSVSKTHAVVEADAAGLWVTDLGSTNGVIIEFDDGTEIELDPGARTPVPAGADILLGDYIVQVERG